MSRALPSTSSSMRVPRSTEVQAPDKSRSFAGHSTDDAPAEEPRLAELLDMPAAIRLALSRAGLSQKLACLEMGGLDESLFTRQLEGKDGAHLSTNRLWKLPASFWRELAIVLGQPLGLTVASQDAADAALLRLATMAHEIAMVTIQQRGLRRAG